jgi:uncharacterized protein YjbI with pentapeptide repeats
VRIAAEELESDAGAGRIEESELADVDFGASKLRSLDLVDVRAERLAAANGDWGGATLRRVELRACRLTGLDLAEARLEDVVLSDCKLDYANLRNSVIENVSFEDCVLRAADFQGARLRAVRFSGCQLIETDFSRAAFEAVDLRGSELALAGSVLGLRGAIVDSPQLVELARAMAAELGIEIRDS